MKRFMRLLGIDKLVQIEDHAADFFERFVLAETHHLRELARAGFAAQGESPRELQLRSRFVARFMPQTRGEVSRLFFDEVAVEQAESLRRDGGGLALGATADRVAEVEHF